MKKLKLDGLRFGRWTVVSEFGKDKNGRSMWKCLCDCGNVKNVETTSLRKGASTSCGCYARERAAECNKNLAHNLEGNRFGRLVAIKRNFDLQKTRKSKSAIWTCLCDCGNTKDVIASALVKENGTRSCGCLGRELSSVRCRELKALPNGEASKNEAYGIYKRRAKLRNYTFELTFRDFIKETQKPCYYCGQEPSNCVKSKTGNGDYVYSGIDRIDNSKGYILGNCVPCCGKCNLMKMHLGFDEFISHVERICYHLYELD